MNFKSNKVMVNLFVAALSFGISIFVNRSVTLDSHSLGISMQEYSKIFPEKSNILQPQRFLLPLLGKITNLDLQILNLIILFLFLSIVFQHLNKFQNFSNSIILTFSLCATMIVQFHLNFGAYPDILSYFLLLLVFISRNEKVVPYILFFLALLVKETNIFTILFFFGLKEISKIKLTIPVLFYIPIYLNLSIGTYGLNHYLQPLKNDLLYWISQSTNYIFLGYFSTIKFLWILVFLFIIQNFKKSIPIFLLIFGISAQFFLGGDTTRFVSFIYLGLLYIFENIELQKFSKLNLLIFLLNVFTYKYYVYAYGQMVVINQSKLSFLDFYSLITQ